MSCRNFSGLFAFTLQLKNSKDRMIRKKLFVVFIVLNVIHYAQLQDVYLNTSHLDKLYQEICINKDTIGIIHIYSEYPAYKWVGDEDEGIACVDDAARASIFYYEYYELTNQKIYRIKAERLIKFILYMQSENGYFYNFIFDDYSINRNHQNSVDIGSWWSWRALWCLTEVGYKINNPKLKIEIYNAINKTVDNIKRDFINNKDTINLFGLKLPAWLPYKYAADQTAIIILSLVNYYNHFKDEVILEIIKKYCDGILLMQAGNNKQFPYYAFLSWENLWHAWGNNQSYALLKAYSILNDKRLLNAALNEINYFYPYLIKNGFMNEFCIYYKNNNLTKIEKKKFPQIAYGIRPMIYAAVMACELTGDVRYYKIALDAFEWFNGKNIVNKKMYHPESGLCYDGIIDSTEINMNSGAESTIEALLSLNRLINNSCNKQIDSTNKVGKH